MTRPVLFIHGGGTGAYAEDRLLADSLQRALGDGLKLAGDWPLVLYHSRDDAVVPFAHLALYAAKLPRATIHELDGGGHQFNNDLAAVARDIASR